MTSFYNLGFQLDVNYFELIYLMCFSFGLMTEDINDKQVLETACRLETYRNQLGWFAAFTGVAGGVIHLSVS